MRPRTLWARPFPGAYNPPQLEREMKLLRTTLFATLLLVLNACGPSPKEVADRYPLVPMPGQLEVMDGRFVVDSTTTILLSDPENQELRRAAHLWAHPLREATGFPLAISGEAAEESGSYALVLRLRAGEGLSLIHI